MYFSLHSSTLCSFYRLKLFPNSHIIIHRIWQTKKNLNYPQNFHSNCHNKILATIEVPCNIEMNFFILENLQTFLHSKHIFWTKPIPCRNVKFSFSKMNFQYLTFYNLMLVVFSLIPVPNFCLTLFHVGMWLWGK